MGYSYQNTIDYAREEGRAEGEKEKAISIARDMLKDGLAADVVSKYTGLTVEAVNNLLK